MTYDARELLRIAESVEKELGFIVVAVKANFEAYTPRETTTAIWGMLLPHPVEFKVLEWGSLADWRRQGAFLQANGKQIAKLDGNPNARFVRLRRVKTR